jgi:hypothetical protein
MSNGNSAATGYNSRFWRWFSLAQWDFRPRASARALDHEVGQAPDHLLGQLEPRQRAQQLAKRDLGLEPGQRGAKAEVGAEAEREVVVVGPRDVARVSISRGT